MQLSYFDLSGKVAIIKGGATGIGMGIAKGLADAGASVIIAARRLEKCEEACEQITSRVGVKTLPHLCDITNKHDVEGLVRHVIKAAALTSS